MNNVKIARTQRSLRPRIPTRIMASSSSFTNVSGMHGFNSQVRFQVPARSAGGSTLHHHSICNATPVKYKNFEDLLNNTSTPILVDFNATWCGPCLIMKDIFKSLSTKMNQQVTFVKIDVDKYPKIASRFQVEALPTLILFKDGKPIDRIEGVVSEEDLAARLKYFVSK